MTDDERAARLYERTIPTHGEHGGPLVRMVAHYEDGSSIGFGHDHPAIAAALRAEPGDDPDLDATDFAHPAWIRGEKHGTAMAAQAMTQVLDTGKYGAFPNSPELEALAQRLDNLRAEPVRESEAERIAAIGILEESRRIQCVARPNEPGYDAVWSLRDAIDDALSALRGNLPPEPTAERKAEPPGARQARMADAHADTEIDARADQDREAQAALERVQGEERDPEWIVNDIAELGVRVGDRLYFLYKGHSLEYATGTHDDGSPMLWRPVFKREFGEVCWPVKLQTLNPTGRYSVGEGWRPLSVARRSPAPEEPAAERNLPRGKPHAPHFDDEPEKPAAEPPTNPGPSGSPVVDGEDEDVWPVIIDYAVACIQFGESRFESTKAKWMEEAERAAHAALDRLIAETARLRTLVERQKAMIEDLDRQHIERDGTA